MATSSKEELKYLEGKLKQNPDSILFARLADLYLSMNRIDEAIKLCEHGIKKYPYYVTGHYIISRCYLQKKQYDHAEKELKRILLFDPNYIAAHRDYGDLMAQIGWNSTCEASYEKILEIDPLNKQAQKHIDELKNKFQLQDDIKEEFDGELGEIEEEAISANVQTSEQLDEEETIEEFEQAFSETDKTITDEEEEKFSYILDDIFRDDDINEAPTDETDKEIKKADEAESPFPIEEPGQEKESETSLLEDEDFESQDIEKWLNENEESDSTTPTEVPPLEESTQKEKSDFLDTEQPSEIEVDSSKNESPPVEDLEEWLDTKVEPEPMESQETDFEKKQETDQTKKIRKKEKIVTPTLGEIYTAQHQYAKAIGVYEILKKNNPDNPIYQQKIDYLKKKLEESKNLES